MLMNTIHMTLTSYWLSQLGDMHEGRAEGMKGVMWGLLSMGDNRRQRERLVQLFVVASGGKGCC